MVRYLSFLFIFLLTPHLKAGVIYEAWGKVLQAGKQVGYYVQRYDYDSKTKLFTSTSFLKTNALGNNVTEALKATSIQVTQPSQMLVPKSYQYTATVNGKLKTIDATFTEESIKKSKSSKKIAQKSSDSNSVLRMKATINEGGTKRHVNEIIPDDTFLSTFLIYIILQSKEGLKVNKLPYSYKAIAEEDAQIYEGTAFVKEEATTFGVDGFKILNDFKKVRFVSYTSQAGEILSTKSPLLSIATEITKNKEEAIQNFGLETKSIKALFGNIPGTKLSKTIKEAQPDGNKASTASSDGKEE